MTEKGGRSQGLFGLRKGSRAVCAPEVRLEEFGVAGGYHTAMKWDENGSNSWEETVIKIYHPEKTLELFFSLGPRKGSDRRDTALEGTYATRTDRMSEKVEAWHAQEALIRVHKKTIVSKKSKDLTKVCFVFSSRTTRDQEVV